MFYVRFVLAALWFLGSSAVGLLFSLLRYGDPSNNRRFSRLCSRGTLFFLGWKVQVAHSERLYDNQPCVYVANHQHNVDLFNYGDMYPPRTVVIGKRQLAKIPIFGLMFGALGNILLDREQRVRAMSQMSQVAERIKKDRISVWIFPEGHRNTRGGLLPFKKGAFFLAKEAGVPLVPIVCADIRPMLDIPRRFVRSGTVHMEVLEPIETEAVPMERIGELVKQTEQRMLESLQRLNALRD